MIWKQFRGGAPRGTYGRALLLLGSMIALVLLFSQVATVLLNADIGLAILNGYENSELVPFGFRINYTNSSNIPSDYIQYHGAMWSRKALTFPTFAGWRIRYWHYPQSVSSLFISTDSAGYAML